MIPEKNKLEAMNEALHAIKDGLVEETRAMAESEISKMEMAELASKGYVNCWASSAGEIYYLTDKGMEYITNYEVIVNFAATFGLMED